MKVFVKTVDVVAGENPCNVIVDQVNPGDNTCNVIVK